MEINMMTSGLLSLLWLCLRIGTASEKREHLRTHPGAFMFMACLKLFPLWNDRSDNAVTGSTCQLWECRSCIERSSFLDRIFRRPLRNGEMAWSLLVSCCISRINMFIVYISLMLPYLHGTKAGQWANSSTSTCHSRNMWIKQNLQKVHELKKYTVVPPASQKKTQMCLLQIASRERQAIQASLSNV